MPLYGRLREALAHGRADPGRAQGAARRRPGYLILGRDIVPDDVPIIGGLDDLVVVALAVDLFLGGVEDELLNEKLGELGIARAAYDDDVARSGDSCRGPSAASPGACPTPSASARGNRHSGVPALRAAHLGGSHRVKVILTSDVARSANRRHEDGRRRLRHNYLIPNQLAVPAAGGAYRAWQHDIASREDKRKREREDAEIAATRIASPP